MRRFFLLTLLAFLSASLVAGCCACRKGKNNKPLVGTTWQLKRMMGRDLQLNSDQFVFTFSPEGRFSGAGACNRLMADYKSSDKGVMQIGALAGTRRMCPDQALEAEFTKIISQITHYEVDGDMLLLLSNGELHAILQAIK
jgi:heat shock protein HslJ